MPTTAISRSGTDSVARGRRSLGSLFSRALTSLRSTRHVFAQPERWTLLSSCDWFPDGSSFPSTHHALLRADDRTP